MPAESTGQKTAAITTVGAGNVIVSAGPGRLNAVLCTAATTGVITIYDNATTNSGTVIGYVASAASIGTFQAYDIPVVNGIVVRDAGGGGITLTVVYSVS